MPPICSNRPEDRNAFGSMMIDDIHKALDEGHIRHGAELFMALRHFLEHHPEARRGLAGD